MERRKLWLGLGACVLVMLLWAAVDSKSFRYCIHDRKDDKAYQALHEEGAFFIKSVWTRVKLHLVCGFVSADGNNGAITALAGVIVALFTVTLWRATDRIQKGAALQTEILKLELASVHRPRLGVRNVEIDQPIAEQEPGLGPKGLLPEIETQVRFQVFNHGGGKATIIHSHVMIFNGPDLPMRSPYEGMCPNDRVPPRQILEVGQSIQGRFNLCEGFAQNILDEVQTGYSRYLWVMGWVDYDDDLSIRRRTAFCRKFDRETRRYRPVDDPDYEHERRVSNRPSACNLLFLFYSHRYVVPPILARPTFCRPSGRR